MKPKAKKIAKTKVELIQDIKIEYEKYDKMSAADKANAADSAFRNIKRNATMSVVGTTLQCILLQCNGNKSIGKQAEKTFKGNIRNVKNGEEYYIALSVDTYAKLFQFALKYNIDIEFSVITCVLALLAVTAENDNTGLKEAVELKMRWTNKERLLQAHDMFNSISDVAI